MKNQVNKIKRWFFKSPVLASISFSFVCSFGGSILLSFLFIRNESIKYYPQNIFFWSIAIFLIVLPLVLTLENILLFIIKEVSNEKKTKLKTWELFAIIIGGFFSIVYITLTDISFSDWQVQLYNVQKHTPISTASFLTILIIVLIAVISYIILSYYPINKIPPLVAVFSIAGLYLGIVQCILWCVQIFDPSNIDFVFLSLFPLNAILIAIRTIKDVIKQQVRESKISGFIRLNNILNKSSNWPWLGFIATIPLLGLIVVVLLIFGQKPDSLIVAWSETADWNLSSKTAPQNLYQDQHYLCTVAAGGHYSIVKPIRTGKRHGNKVIVNRQLCIANAFEQVIEEKTPNFHKILRSFYDKTGYPIAKHIKSPYTADFVYILMKPLEWIFLGFLYLFDVKPENRIATQYPHAKLPKVSI